MYDLKHLTLTIRNMQDLPQMLKHLVGAFRRLRQRKLWKSNVEGGAFVLEVTGAPGNWHAHIHAVLYCRWIGWESLRDSWRSVSGSPGVYIQRIPRLEVVRYLTKYITKPASESAEEGAALNALKGYRLFQPFGCWLKVLREYIPEPFLCPNCKARDWIPECLCDSFELAYLRQQRLKSGLDPPSRN